MLAALNVHGSFRTSTTDSGCIYGVHAFLTTIEQHTDSY